MSHYNKCYGIFFTKIKLEEKGVRTNADRPNKNRTNVVRTKLGAQIFETELTYSTISSN
jgi:hypothetical protein